MRLKIKTMKKLISIACFLNALLNIFYINSAKGACANPESPHVSIVNNEVIFSWSGTPDADIHAILLWDKNKQQYSKAFTTISPTFSTQTIPNGSYRWKVIALCNTSSSQANLSEWIWGDDFDFSGGCTIPSTAKAGQDQNNISGTSAQLSAIAPAVGTGEWSIISGVGGSFSNSNSPTSIFTGIEGVSYILRWTVSNTCGSSYDDVNISLIEACPTVPPISLGTDIYTRAESVSISAPIDPNWNYTTTTTWEIYRNGMFYQHQGGSSVTINRTNEDIYSIVCKISNGCSTSSSNEIQIIFCPPPTNAGTDQIVEGTSTTLNALGTGAWTILTGEGGSISEPNNPTSSFSGVLGTTYLLQWNQNDNCGNNYDTVSIFFCSVPTIPVVNGLGCIPTGEFMLNGKLNPGEIGTWSVTQGDGGVFSNIDDPESAFLAQPNQTYIIRWTVSNACGSAYNENLINVRTKKYNNPYLNPNLEYGTVTDIDCNQYPTIQIGNQTWMAENLRTARLNDGASIPYSAYQETNSQSNNIPWLAYYGPNILNVMSDTSYGALYSWGAARNPKLCPKGWMVPSDGDFLFLKNLGSALISESGWDPQAHNESGFSGIPSGRRNSGLSNFNSGGFAAYYWTNFILPTGYNQYAALGYFLTPSNFSGIPTDFNFLLACRCIKDDCTKVPTANAGADNLNNKSLSVNLAAENPSYGTGQWSIISGEGGVMELSTPLGNQLQFTGKAGETYLLQWTVSGACTSASDTVTVSFCPSISTADAGIDQLNIIGTSTILAASNVEYGSGSWRIISGSGGSISTANNPQSSFYGLAGNSYVLLWTISTACDSNYDEVTISFERFLNPDLSYGTVTDIDNNTYSTIQIGNQTWMAENLKTTKYNDGVEIPNITLSSEWTTLTNGAWCYYNNDSTKNNPYGKMYNWHSVATGKLCPQGWRIPSQSDFNQLASYLGSAVGGQLKSINGWAAPNTGANNSSGFSGLPGGTRDAIGVFSGLGNLGYWWTSTDMNDGINSDMRRLRNDRDTFSGGASGFNHKRGLSCRCIKD